MIAIGIRYLTGYATATDLASGRPEWPPHPARVFMAMAAAHFESGADPGERSVLEWLEAEPAPSLYSGSDSPRTIVEAFVPVNDNHGGILMRSRQARTFQRTRPDQDTVYLVWNSTPGEQLRQSLAALCRKVTRVGHSSSLVQMWMITTNQMPECNWFPSKGVTSHRLRVPVAGTLRMLETAFNQQDRDEYGALGEAIASARGARKKTLQKERDDRFPDGPPTLRHPQITTWKGYAPLCDGQVRERVVQGPFDADFIVLTKQEGSSLGLESTLQLTGALRNAAMKAAGERPPEWLTGHTLDGAPSKQPHVAFFPLPYIGYEHADGHIMGLGMAIPSSIVDDDDVRRVIGALLFSPQNSEIPAIRLWRTGAWNWTIERETRERPPQSLRRDRWGGPSRIWASVTPVVLHHYPKKSRDDDVERIVREAFHSALIPEPEEVIIRSASMHSGAGHARSVPIYEEGGSEMCRYQVHVKVRFRECVEGPMLVGRGRFRGYGLFAPIVNGTERK